MVSVLASVGVVVLVLLMGLAGFRDGVFFTTYAFLRNLFAFLLAVTFAETLAAMMETVISDTYPSGYYFYLISYMLIIAAVFAFGRFLKVRHTVPHVPCPPLMDKIGGPILGVMNGIVMTGILLVAWSLVPFAKYLPANLGDGRCNSIDTGAIMLRSYGFLAGTDPEKAGRMGGSKPFLLNDEPIVGDENANGRADPGEAFQDIKPNGIWDRGWLWRYRNHYAITPDDLGPG